MSFEVNRWAFLTILVLVAGAVSAFAVYTFGWREDDGTGDERATAEAYAWAIARGCQEDGTCRIAQLDRLAARLWRVRLDYAETGEADACVLIQLDRFAPRADGWFTGANGGAC